MTCIAQTELLPFRAICASEKETGFNWRNGQWVQSTFRSGTQTIVQKIDLKKNSELPLLERANQCKTEAPRIFGTWTESRGCYLIKEVGSPKTTLHGEMCSEHFVSSTLLKIVCKSMTFVPDGNYSSSPEYSDISSNPKNDYKDSLVLAVGQCSRLTE